MSTVDQPLFLSPPVVQHAGRDGFTISIEVSRLCTGRVEWGHAAGELTLSAVAATGGLIDAHDRCLVIPVRFADPARPGQTIFYRVVGGPLDYANAYDLTRGPDVGTAVQELKLPDADREAGMIAIVNDTHDKADNVKALAARIDDLDPDVLVWNGDVCDRFEHDSDPVEVLLRPGATGPEPSDGGWASTRPLLYVRGNHELRGPKARDVPRILAPGPDAGLPYNSALRVGPLAVVTLDTGEDKPDHHPVFGGTAAYEPYRERQAEWLAEQFARPAIADARFKVVCCHIPLRGLPGQDDGSTLEDYARFSGHGAGLWLPQLIRAGARAVISGHTHVRRCDKPTAEVPIAQVVGGGWKPDSATVIVVRADSARLSIRTEDVGGNVLAEEAWT